MFMLKDVSLTLRSKTIFRNINLSIEKGLNIIKAPTGAGKTTFLKMLVFLISPNTGDIFYKSDNVKTLNMPLFRSKCIMVPQSITFIEHKVFDSIRNVFLLKYHSFKKLDNSYLYDLLNVFKLNKSILESSVYDISGGEVQRIALIRALLLKPETLILDEPTSFLDKETSEVVFGYLKIFARHHLIIISSHSSIADYYADFIFEINNCKVLKV